MTRVFFFGALVGAVLGAVGCGPPTFNVGVPFAVTSTVPSANEKDVGHDVLPTITFNRAVSESTAEAGLQILVDGKAVDRTVSPHQKGKVMELILKNALPADTDAILAIKGTVASTDGVPLDADVQVTFHTGP